MADFLCGLLPVSTLEKGVFGSLFAFPRRLSGVGGEVVEAEIPCVYVCTDVTCTSQDSRGPPHLQAEFLFSSP